MRLIKRGNAAVDRLFEQFRKQISRRRYSNEWAAVAPFGGIFAGLQAANRLKCLGLG